MEPSHVLATASLNQSSENTPKRDQIDAFYEANGCEVWTWFLRVPERLRLIVTYRHKTETTSRPFANIADAR